MQKITLKLPINFLVEVPSDQLQVFPSIFLINYVLTGFLAYHYSLNFSSGSLDICAFISCMRV